MSVRQALLERSHGFCELCGSQEASQVFEVPYSEIKNAQSCLMLCDNCNQQIAGTQEMDINHWRCLNDSMWSTEPAAQVMAWRMLNRLSSETWAQDLLDILYLDEETQQWAAKDTNANGEGPEAQTLDSNGARLEIGDTVTLIND